MTTAPLCWPSDVPGRASLGVIAGPTRSSRTCSSATGRGSASRVDDEFRKKQRERAERSLAVQEPRPGRGRAWPASEDGRRIRQRFEAMVEQSGLDLHAGQARWRSRRARRWRWGPLGGLLRQSLVVGGRSGAAVGAGCRSSTSGSSGRRGLEKLRSQLPDAFDLMARVVRAGQTMSPGAAGGRRRVRAADRRRVLLLLRAAEPRPVARGRAPRPGAADRPARDEDLRPGRAGPAADRRQPRRAAGQALDGRPRAVTGSGGRSGR